MNVLYACEEITYVYYICTIIITIILFSNSLYTIFFVTVRLAALRRATASTIPAVSSHSSPTTSGLQLQASRLEEICVKFLVRRSRDYGLPSCSGLSSFVAESLITALAENKMLNTKTLTSFSRWLASQFSA